MTSDHPVKRRKKLIEVAIPLEAINAASAREKSIRHGHPSTLHLWWARRPLAAARAVIFCQMVDDPSAVPEEFPTEEDQENERLRLFALISELVQWESTTKEKEVLEPAREEIRRSWHRCCADNAEHPEADKLFNPQQLPGFHDPFAGGGALPLEAQRLGLESYATDLNPVAVLINKAMIEIPPKFGGMPPVNPESRAKKDINSWTGAQGLAEDVRYYGKWMRDEAEKRIGHLYPKVTITPEIVDDPSNPRPDLLPYKGKQLNVIAWIWARTVKSPNPAFSHVDVPLASSFMLSTKEGCETFVVPLVDRDKYSFRVRVKSIHGGEGSSEGTKRGRGGFRCLITGDLIDSSYIKRQAQAGLMGTRLMAIAVEGERGRVFLDPLPDHESSSCQTNPEWRPDTEFFQQALGFRIGNYGMSKWSDLFTDRQITALSTLAGLAQEVQESLEADSRDADLDFSTKQLCEGGNGAKAYAQAVALMLGIGVSRLADAQNSLCQWGPSMNQTQHLFRSFWATTPTCSVSVELLMTWWIWGSMSTGCTNERL